MQVKIVLEVALQQKGENSVMFIGGSSSGVERLARHFENEDWGTT
jgi:hypothetical protein